VLHRADESVGWNEAVLVLQLEITESHSLPGVILLRVASSTERALERLLGHDRNFLVEKATLGMQQPYIFYRDAAKPGNLFIRELRIERTGCRRARSLSRSR